MTEQKVLDEARQADELRQLLREVLPILRWAFFANFRHQERCDEVYARIKGVLGDENDKSEEANALPVKHAHWIKGHCGADEYIKCSVCRTKTVNAIVSLEGDAAENYFELCPKCGARMDGDSHDQP